MNRRKSSSYEWCRVLCVLLAFLQTISLAAMQKASPLPLSAASQKIRDEVKKVPIGGKLTVFKTDGTEYHGHLQAITPQDFSFIEVDLKQTFTLPYSEVERVSKNYGGKGIGGKRVNPRKSLIVGAVTIGAVFVVLLVALAMDKS
jgi:hypothetical protein